MSIRDRLK